MKIHNKRGIGLEWYALILAFFIGLGFYFVTYLGEHKVIQNYIGQYQFSILKTANEAEKAIFYVQQSAKYSLQQSIYELARNGGYSEIDSTDIDSSGLTNEDLSLKSNNECRNYYGYSVWYVLNKDETGEYIKSSCIDDEKIKSNLGYMFNKNLNAYLLKHPHNAPTNNYNYEIRDELEIIGKAISPLVFDILKDETKEFAREAIQTPEGMIDFTATEFCAKGRRCLLTKEAYDLLLKAEEIAKKKFEQKGIESDCLNENKACLEVTFGYRTLEEQTAIWKRNPNSKYVCPPSPACPHLTGKVVDVVFDGKTRFTMTKLDWQILNKTMSEAGWVRYSTEPWHFECCNTDRYARAKAKGVTEIV